MQLISKWNLLIIFIYFTLMLPPYVTATETIRVLIVDSKNPLLPQKNEKITKIGVTKGELNLHGKKYFGNFEVWKGENGLYVINELPLEDYLKGVVAAEVGSKWEEEALKAQAVASRTYALYQKKNNNSSGPLYYHLTSSVLHQVYRGELIPQQIINAVNATKGEILLYEGEPILAFYHSTSGGLTEDCVEVFGKDLPYLKPVETNSELSPFYIWEKKIHVNDIEKATNIKQIKEIFPASQTITNRVKDFKIITNNGEYLFPAKDLRKNIGWDKLPSTKITSLVKEGNYYIFQGKGYGHGVGMCQWTAQQMAKDGKNYREILSKFYPGTVIKSYVE
ncbi:MAG: SpoIID/LytB domain-containing protein [Thermodesulfovibrionales bacterium]|nr:SpoIID/LytB domain-containing protein [Thermodesulfovibrionales bacterium]